MELKVVKVGVVEGCNVILGMAHFIKTVEDLYEALVNSVPNIKFGLAFCESSGPCLVRSEGTDEELKKIAEKNALALSCGHCFIIYLRNAYPINVLGRIREVPEVCTVYASTANPLEIIVVETEQGRGVLGVVDGFKSVRLETEKEVEERKIFLRNINYKL
jgi:adenosine/AMP kinase